MELYKYLLIPNRQFPLQQAGRSSACCNFTNQGNEYREDVGLNWMDFHNRQYDPQLGRFMGIDPMADAEGQQGLSPYHAMACNPSTMVDSLGLFVTGPAHEGMYPRKPGLTPVPWSYMLLCMPPSKIFDMMYGNVFYSADQKMETVLEGIYLGMAIDAEIAKNAQETYHKLLKNMVVSEVNHIAANAGKSWYSEPDPDNYILKKSGDVEVVETNDKFNKFYGSNGQLLTILGEKLTTDGYKGKGSSNAWDLIHLAAALTPYQLNYMIKRASSLGWNAKALATELQRLGQHHKNQLRMDAVASSVLRGVAANLYVSQGIMEGKPTTPTGIILGPGESIYNAVNPGRDLQYDIIHNNAWGTFKNYMQDSYNIWNSALYRYLGGRP